MGRPGAVIEVDRNTPPVMFHFGEGVRLEKLPLGSRIVYPPDPLEPIAHPERAVKRALAKPLEDDPLKSLLRRGMKLTIAFDDLSLPLPPMAAPDVRQLVMEQVIDMAAEAGVEDIHLIAALGLPRLMKGDEVGHIDRERDLTTARYHTQTTVNNHAFPAIANFMQRRETDWTAQDQAMFLATKQLTDLAPPAVKRNFFHAMRAPYGLTGVNAGQVDAVHDKTLENVRSQLSVRVEGQTDIVTIGVPYLGPYNVNAPMNPVLVVCMGAGYLFNFYRNKPVLRKGGVLILTHPCRYEFDAVQHPSYIDFYDEVLADTTDPFEIEKKYELRFAEDPWFRQLYRKSNAYHGAHPFYAFYWAAHAMEHAGDIIIVGGERDVVHRLGFKCATTLEDAFEMAEQTVGRHPSVTHLRMRPIMLCDVE